MRQRRGSGRDDLPLVCRQLVEMVTDYLEGALDPALRRRVEDHLTTCDPCVGYVNEVRLVLELTRELPREPLPPTMLDSLTSAFRAHHERG